MQDVHFRVLTQERLLSPVTSAEASCPGTRDRLPLKGKCPPLFVSQAEFRSGKMGEAHGWKRG